MISFRSLLLCFLLSFVVVAAAEVDVVAEGGIQQPEQQQNIVHHHEHHHGTRRLLIDGGRRVQYTSTDRNERCDSQYGNPCGPDSKCTPTDDGYICENEFYYGCVAGCDPNSVCTKGDDNIYFCKCNEGYYRPQSWLPCRTDE